MSGSLHASASRSTMRAMRIAALAPVSSQGSPLSPEALPVPTPKCGELLIRVSHCGVCHTELDEIEGRTPPARLPMTPGHQAVGTVVEAGPDGAADLVGERVGVAWIHGACGQCAWCREERENLCPDFRACGRDADGGYAEYMTVPQGFVHRIPEVLGDAECAPLLCAGAVGLRALRLCRLDNGKPLGLTGFGASAHLVLPMARHLYPDSEVYVFARNPRERQFARELGAAWAGDTEEAPPQPPQAVIDTTPAWKPVLAALACVAPGGRVVINAIRKESADQNQWQKLDYDRHLWREKRLITVANVTRRDVRRCLELAAEIPLRPTVEVYPLEQANLALRELKSGTIRGAKVLKINSP